LIPVRSAAHDFLVEWDSLSLTGNALFYRDVNADQLSATVARVTALRSDPVVWAALVARLLATAPSWKKSATLLDHLKTAAAQEADLQAATS
jgi:hypothetical protein